MLIIGDVHGQVDRYWKILQKHKGKSIQVGDFGFRKQHQWHLKNIDSSLHKINFGNHDDYTFLEEAHSCKNFSFYNEHNLMTVRGAMSSDRASRIEGKEWWSNEELSYSEMQSAIELFTIQKPEIMITHDCPQSIRKSVFSIADKSLTSNGLQMMFELHQPLVWIFGHHHKSIDEIINKTTFICLPELETLSI